MFDSPRSFADFEPFLNSEQAAALVKVHPKTLQRLARNGRVVGYRVGKLWRFRASDLDEFLLVEVAFGQLSVPSQNPSNGE
jgi:excisionase family DNA binding protein